MPDLSIKIKWENEYRFISRFVYLEFHVPDFSILRIASASHRSRFLNKQIGGVVKMTIGMKFSILLISYLVNNSVTLHVS